VSEDAAGRLDVGMLSGNATFREKVSGGKLTGATRRPSSVNCAVHELKDSQQGRDTHGARPCHGARDNVGAGVIARRFAKTSRHLDCLAPVPSSFLDYHDTSSTHSRQRFPAMINTPRSVNIPRHTRETWFTHAKFTSNG